MAADGDTPSERAVVAIGEAKAGEQLTTGHLKRLEAARLALGARASDAKLLLFGARVERSLTAAVRGRTDVELVDLERLYNGA